MENLQEDRKKILLLPRAYSPYIYSSENCFKHLQKNMQQPFLWHIQVLHYPTELKEIERTCQNC
jgi:hypothetical protein